MPHKKGHFNSTSSSSFETLYPIEERFTLNDDDQHDDDGDSDDDAKNTTTNLAAHTLRE